LTIAVLTVAAAVAAFAVSKLEKPVYEATATVSYVDDSYGLTLLGSPVSSNLIPPAQTPAARAATVTAPSVVSAVARALHHRLPQAVLAASASATVDPKTELVEVTAKAGDPSLAAELANEFATKAADLTNLQARGSYSGAAHVLTQQLNHAVGTGPDALATRASLIDQISRLGFLQTTATPAQVVTRAQPPGTPASPRTKRNALLGALAGLLIGLIIAFVSDSLDRRLRGSREIQQALDYPVLGRIRDDAIGHVLVRGRTGALNGNGRARAEDVEAIQILRHNLAGLGERDRVRRLLVTSAVPQEGKSTVAASLAFSLAATGSRTLLMECDLRRPTLAERLRASPRPGVTDYLYGGARSEDVVQRIPLWAGSTPANGVAGNGRADHPLPARALSCIVAGAPTASPIELLESERLHTFLDAVSADFDVVILDSPPLLVVADTLALLPHVDGVILCVRSSHTTREQAEAAREVLARSPELAVGIAVTGLRPRDKDDSYSYTFAGYA
jgi:Mrp family chromosome partitioning ATPase